jgi:hypothetical protein
LIRDLIRVAKENKVKDEVIDNLLDQQTKYHGVVFKSRKYKDIVEGRFDLAEIIRIERKNDENTISDKSFDFSSGTIKQLMNDGYEDTVNFLKTRYPICFTTHRYNRYSLRLISHLVFCIDDIIFRS